MTTMTTEQIAPTTIGSTVEERRLAPIGARLQASRHRAIIMTKVGPDLWRHDNGTERSNDHPGWYTTPHSTYTVLDWPVLGEGDTLHYGFEREVLPVGSQIALRGSTQRTQSVFTKTGSDEWEEREEDGSVFAIRRNHQRGGWLGEDNPTRYGYLVQRVGPEASVLNVAGPLGERALGSTFWWRTTPEIVWQIVEGGAVIVGAAARAVVDLSMFEGPMREGALVFSDAVDSATTTEVSSVAELPVGHVIASDEEFDSLPVGTVITWENSHTRTKNDDGRWYLSDREDGSTSHHLSNNEWVITTLPGAHPTVGQQVMTTQQFIDLPVGSQITSREGRVYTKRQDRWDGGLGGSGVRSPRTGGFFTLTRFGEEDESTITIAAHEAAMAAAAMAAVATRNEQFLSELREAWDGQSFLRGEINEVLASLGIDGGIEEPRETITVDVEVEGTTLLDNDDVEGLFEGTGDCRINSEVEVSWRRQHGYSFEVEVDEGDCGCEDVDDDMVQSRLDGDGITYSTFTFSVSCSND